jgi:hypothetical protein
VNPIVFVAGGDYQLTKSVVEPADTEPRHYNTTGAILVAVDSFLWEGLDISAAILSFS